jgi:hypothetical protein
MTSIPDFEAVYCPDHPHPEAPHRFTVLDWMGTVWGECSMCGAERAGPFPSRVLAEFDGRQIRLARAAGAEADAI